MKTFRTTTAEETQSLGETLARELRAGGIVCLYGDLGAGKTTLVQGLARGLGLTDRIVSPTFILVRRYPMKKSFLYHVDLYRLNDDEEIKGLSLSEFWEDPGSVVVIEWPEKIEKILPKNALKIKLRSLSEGEREIAVEL